MKQLLALFLFVNLVGVLLNLPAVLASVDGTAVGRQLQAWIVGVSTASGDLVQDATADQLTSDEVNELQHRLRAGELESPLDDASVRALVQLWEALRDAGAQLQADELRELLLDQGVDPSDAVPGG